jgi:hypothetical protein
MRTSMYLGSSKSMRYRLSYLNKSSICSCSQLVRNSSINYVIVESFFNFDVENSKSNS